MDQGREVKSVSWISRRDGQQAEDLPDPDTGGVGRPDTGQSGRILRRTPFNTDPSAPTHGDDTSDVDDVLTFRGTAGGGDTPDYDSVLPASATPTVGRQRPLCFSPPSSVAHMDGASTSADSPHQLGRTPTPSSSAGRRLSLADQEQFRHQLRQRANRAQTKAHGRAQRRSRGQMGSRFDRLKESGTSKQMEEYLANRQRSQVGPSSEEAYQFFCRVWEDPPPAVPAQQSADTGTDALSESRPLVEVIGIDPEPLVVTEHPRPFVDEHVSSKLEQITFCPASSDVAVEDKLAPGQQVRDLTEDGIYVPPRALKRCRNSNVLQHRLLKHSGRAWFGEDGELLTVPDPLLPHTRRHVFDDVSDSIITEFIQPSSDQLVQVPRGRDEDLLNYQLNIHLLRVRFFQHPLFSREHAVVAALTELLEQHAKMERDGTVHRLSQRLWAVRRARDSALAAYQLQPSVPAADGRAEENGEQLERSLAIQRARIRQYGKSVRRLRTRRDQTAGEQRRLCRSILRRWRELKGLRETQGFCSCPVRLQIHQFSPAADDVIQTAAAGGDASQTEEQLWQLELEAELNELCLEHEQQYQPQFSRYKQELTEWKQLRAQLSEAGDGRHGTANQLQQQLGPRPQPPAEFDPDKVLRDVEARARSSRRPPGEPLLRFELLCNQPVTDTDKCPKQEQQRRASVLRSAVSVRALIGCREVSRSKPRPLDGRQLTVALDTLFPTRLRQPPDHIQLWVCQSGAGAAATVALGSGTATVLAKLRVPPPDSHVTRQTARPVWWDFAGDSTTAVRGQIETLVYWACDETGALLAPPASDLAFIESALVDPSGELNDCLDLETDLLMDDTAAERLGDVPAAVSSAAPAVSSRLTINSTVDPLAALSLGADISLSWRCRLLRLRNADVPEFRNVTMAPLRDGQVPMELFQKYEARLRIETGSDEAAFGDDADRLKDSSAGRLAGRDAVLRYRARIQETVSRRFRAAQRYKQLHDVVREDQAPVIGTLGSMFGTLFSARRPLNPTREQMRPRALADLQGQQLQLVCHVVRSFNVPIRRDPGSLPTPLLAAGSVDGHTPVAVGASGVLPEVLVRPFVEVTFQRSSVRSNVAEGPNPTWNQDLRLPVRLGSHEPAELQCLGDVVYLSLQDEVLVDMLEDDRRRDTSVHHRIERRWLADLKIPFSTLYINQRVEGTFRLNSPPLLIGYECDVTVRSTAYHLTEMGLPTGQSGTYLTIFMTLEPSLNIPPMIEEKLDSIETEKVLRHCTSWLQEYRSQYPERPAKCTVMDVGGKSTLVCRYLRPIKPPDALLAVSSSADDQALLAARFVALIPNISDVTFFSGMYDLWITSQEFIDMLAGDEEEHAILLCNFLLYLGKRAYLVLGSGIPEGRTAYVLTDEATERWLWNPCTGVRTRTTDSFSYLQRVACIISSENVWANTQLYAHPAGMQFDVNLVRDWRPLFSRQQFPTLELPSIQERSLRYWGADTAGVLKETERLEKKLREQFQSWRQKTNWTQWNRSCSEALRSMLPHLERATYTPSFTPDQLTNMQNKLLANIQTTYKISGIPLNLPYHSTSDVIEAVYACAVHRNDSRDSEFALAVYMEPYPCSVASVWVYIASLTRRR